MPTPHMRWLGILHAAVQREIKAGTCFSCSTMSCFWALRVSSFTLRLASCLPCCFRCSSSFSAAFSLASNVSCLFLSLRSHSSSCCFCLAACAQQGILDSKEHLQAPQSSRQQCWAWANYLLMKVCSMGQHAPSAAPCLASSGSVFAASPLPPSLSASLQPLHAAMLAALPLQVHRHSAERQQVRKKK